MSTRLRYATKWGLILLEDVYENDCFIGHMATRSNSLAIRGLPCAFPRSLAFSFDHLATHFSLVRARQQPLVPRES